MRRATALALLALAASACGGESVRRVSPSATATPQDAPPTRASLAPSLTPSPTTSPAIDLPPDGPATYPKGLAAVEVPVDELVPPGGEVTSVWRLPQSVDQVPQIALAWTRGADPFAAEHGFAVWQQFPGRPPWRVVYAFTDPPAAGVLGVRFEAADLTGDAIVDALTFEDMGGSGGCGVSRVVQSGAGFATQIFRRMTCDTQIQVENGALRIRAAVYEPGDSHCCPSRFRTTTIRWDGESWNVTDKVVTPA